MKQRIGKAYEITDAKIQFVSLVDKAANQRQFLLKKAADGKASFTSCGRILKKDAANHYVTGIVYEPLAEDSQGNFMTEAEITKAAYWFAKNGDKVDLQHSFEPLSGAAVVENWVAKADFAIDGQPVKKGSWLMTVEVTDDEVWARIEENKITGFSMGGLGNYSEEDVVLEKQGLLQQLAAALGFADKPVAKAGKKLSDKNRETLNGIYESLGAFLKELEPINDETEKKEEIAVTKQEVEQIVEAAVAKAMEGPAKGGGQPAASAEITPDVVAQMVEAAVAKATQPQEQVSAEQVQEIVEAAVEKALQSKGLPSNLNGSGGVQKAAEQHYLHGIL